MSQFEENTRKVFSEQLKTIIDSWEKANGKKLSQQTLADTLHVSRETVSRWVNGRNAPLDDKKMMADLCNFFSVPLAYFSKSNYEDGWTMIDMDTHILLNEHCKRVAEKIGLRPSFVSLLKDVPELADSVIHTSCIDAQQQSVSPDVPAIPDHLYQFVSSTGIKIYPPDDVLYMLRVVQRDMDEYLLFLFSKYRKEYDKYMNRVKNIQRKSKNNTIVETQKRGCFQDIDAETGEEYPKKPICVFSDKLHGQEGLSTDESCMLNLYRAISEEGKNIIYNTMIQERKKHPSKKTKAIKAAIRKSIGTREPVPPVSDIISEE